MEKSFDLLIVGAGMSGVLLASKIRVAKPDWKIGILDKESGPGGRLASKSAKENRWYWGLSGISQNVLEAIQEDFKLQSEGSELQEYIEPPLKKLGVLAAGKVQEIALEDSFSAQGGRAIAGAAAARDWTLVDELMSLVEDEKKSTQPLSTLWKGTRKSPSAIALEHLARLWGIPDIWSISPQSLKARFEDFQSSLLRGDWVSIMEDILSSPAAHSSIETIFDASVIAADYADETWTLRTTRGEHQAPRLVVAQSPWEALLWLPKEHWPAKLVALSSKTKPISGVLLSERIESIGALPEDFSDVLVVLSEGVQVYFDLHNQAICYQATIPYEMTLDAPEVVKAVRRLKRAKKKLMNTYEGFASAGEHIALVPVAWSQPIGSHERRVVEKIDMSKLQQSHLCFCGDSYGGSLKSDENLLHSVESAHSELAP